jgi:hypothetical protein
VILSLVSPLAGGANPGSRVLTETEIVSDLGALTEPERRELAQRRAAVEARVEEFRQRLVAPCANLRELVRDALGSVDRVGAVDPGPALLTSNPPKFRVNYVVALTSGRLVQDEVVVVVPLEVSIVRAADEAMGRQARQCGRAAPGG